MSLTKLIRFNEHKDQRGSLIALENGRDIPFDVKRVYYIFDTSPNYERGFHAHLELKQLLICVSGSLEVEVCKGTNDQETFLLDSPSKGLLIEGLVWRVMKNFTPGAVLMVLASEFYNKDDYIFDFDKFIALTQNNN